MQSVCYTGPTGLNDEYIHAQILKYDSKGLYEPVQEPSQTETPPLANLWHTVDQLLVKLL